jgi:NAD(P)-dependent dehydrogenase (short-subunit alcohol dehydrogenase family)
MALLNPFADKVIAITGAASGIGLATAMYLSERGASLSLADNRQEPLDEAVRLIQKTTPNTSMLAQVVDVRSSNDVQQWIAATIDKFGFLSGAANLAGVVGKSIGRVGIANYDEDEWDFVTSVNLKGVFLCMKAELQVIEIGGSIVNAASIAGVRGLPKYVHWPNRFPRTKA